MGLAPFSRSSYDAPKSGNPDPRNCIIEDAREYGDRCVLLVRYPDCINYEGRKILLFIGTTLADLVKQGMLDPHFSDRKKYKSPFARFEPTPKGWQIACVLAEYFPAKEQK